MNLDYFFSLSSEAQCVISKTGSILKTNPAFKEILGYEEEEVSSKEFLHFIQLEDRNNLQSAVTEGCLCSKLKTQQAHFLKKDGAWELMNWKIIKAEDGNSYVIGKVSAYPTLPQEEKSLPATAYFLAEDMEEYLQNQKKLNQHLQIYKDFFEMSNDMLSVINLDGGFQVVNSTFYKSLGYSEQELLSIPMMSLIHQDDRKAMLKATENLTRGCLIDHFECRFKCRNGQFKWLLCNGVPVKSKLLYMVATDITQKKENEIKQKELLANTITLNQELEYHNQELTKQEEVLRQSYEETRRQNSKLEKVLKELEEKNFELDQFVYRTSHDIRSPLATILGIINLTKMEGSESQLRRYIDIIEERTHKLDGFTRSIFNYSISSRSRIEAEKIYFEDRVNECFSSLEYHKNYSSIDKQINIEYNGADFYCDKLRVSVILANLISNAVKFQDPSKSNHYLNINVQVNSQVAFISVSDNGIGIEEQYVEKIYDMFFRGSEKSDGSGLGLYIAKQTIEKLGGTIKVISNISQGTTFNIWLPNQQKVSRGESSARN